MKLLLVGAKYPEPMPMIWVNGFCPVMATGPEVPASRAYWIVDGMTGTEFRNAACDDVTGTTTVLGGRGWPMAADTKREMSTDESSPKLPVPMLENPVSWRSLPS